MDVSQAVIKYMDLNGNNVETLSSSHNPTDVVFYDGFVYWTDAGSSVEGIIRAENYNSSPTFTVMASNEFDAPQRLHIEQSIDND